MSLAASAHIANLTVREEEGSISDVTSMLKSDRPRKEFVQTRQRCRVSFSPAAATSPRFQ